MNKEEKWQLETLSVPLGNWQITQCKGFFSSIFQPKHCRRIVPLPAGHTPPGGWAAALGHGYRQWPPGHYVETQQMVRSTGYKLILQVLAPSPLASSMTSPTAFPISMWLSQRSFRRSVPDITLFLNDYKCCQNFNMRRNRKGNLTDWWEMTLDRIRGEHLALHLPPSCINQYKKQ